MRITRLGELRGRTYLTQQALAERSGVSRDTISKLENGQRKNARARTASKLAEALDVEPRELQGRPPPLGRALESTSRNDVEQTKEIALGAAASMRGLLERLEENIREDDLAGAMAILSLLEDTARTNAGVLARLSGEDGVSGLESMRTVVAVDLHGE